MHTISRRNIDGNYFYITTGLMSIVAMLISLLVGLRQSVWFDEAYSILVARAPIGELVRLTSLDTHPPLYYMLLKTWAAMFGWSEVALRSFSVVALGATIVMAAILVRRLFNAKAALVATIFMVVAPMMLRYGFEIRMYSLAALIGVTATYALVRALYSRQRGWWTAYSILVAMGMLTLYYTAFIWFSHLVWLVWRALQRKHPHRCTPKTWIGMPWTKAYIGSFVLFLPWLPTFIAQMTNGALAPIGQPMNIDNLLGIMSFNFVYRPIWQLDMPLTVLMMFAIVMVVVIVIEAWKLLRDQPQRESYALLLSYVLTPIVVLIMISFIKSMYVERYLAHIVVAIMMLLGVAIYIVLTRENKQHRTMLAGAQLLFIVALVGMVNMIATGNFNLQRLQYPLIREAVDSIGTCDERTTVVAADSYVMTELSYYLPAHCRVLFSAETESLKGGYGPLSTYPGRQTDMTTVATPTVWYFYYGDPNITFSDEYRVVQRERFDSLNVAKMAR